MNMQNGIINILKPANMTSHQVVSHVRRALNIKKVGHTGTLDPNAMGVLPICIGKATRVSEYVMDLSKGYRAEVTFGITSDTGDLYGTIQQVHEKPHICKESILPVIKSFEGTITQTPPMASAIKVKGKKLYEYHRKGLDVEIPKRQVNIYSLDIVEDFPISNTKLYIDIHCSKGTYVRTLCQDIGKKLGFGGLMSYLIRTKVGPFNLSNTVMLNQLNQENYRQFMFPADIVLTHLDKAILDDNSIERISNGVNVKYQKNLETDLVRVYDRNNDFFAICKNNEGLLKPHKVFK